MPDTFTVVAERLRDSANCPACDNRKTCVHYLCPACWRKLPEQARAELKTSPSIDEGLNRLSALRYQLLIGVPLSRVQIASWWESYHAAREPSSSR